MLTNSRSSIGLNNLINVLVLKFRYQISIKYIKAKPDLETGGY